MVRNLTAIDFNRTLPNPPKSERSPTRSNCPSLQLQESPPEDKHRNLVRPLQPISSKQQLHSVTHKLLTQGSPPHTHWRHCDVDSVDPVKFSPPENDKARPAMAER